MLAAEAVMRGKWQKEQKDADSLLESDLVEECLWLVEELYVGFVIKEERWDDQHCPRVSSPQALADFFEMSKLGWR